jgi:hypothetical protein
MADKYKLQEIWTDEFFGDVMDLLKQTKPQDSMRIIPSR